MNSLACEAEVPVQNENALRFSIVSKPVPILEYIKTISSLVGASHILAIFEENETLKIFFDDKVYVDALIRSGIHVMGHHVKIDYVVPPGTKIVLSNVDPVITNMDIVSILSAYGTVVSPIIRPPISDDTELCHIGYGVRYVYMNLAVEIPSSITISYGDQHYMVKTKVDDRPIMFAIPFIKTDNSDETTIVSSFDNVAGPSRIQNGIESVAVVESETNSTLQIASSMSLKVKRKGRRRRGRPRSELFGKCKKVSPTSQAAHRIRRNVKNKYMSAQKVQVRNINFHSGNEPVLHTVRDSVSATDHNSVGEIPDEDKPTEFTENNSNIPFKPILDMQKLIMFLDEVKGHRAPIELAKKYIGESYTPNSVHLLCQQMRIYNASHNDLNLKARIMRLIKTLKDSM